MNETLPKFAADLAARRAAARALVDQGHALEAERAFAELLRDAPDDADALNFLAIWAHGRNHVDEALDLLGRALGAHPEDATTLTNLGVLYREQNRLAEAYAALTQSIRVAPDLFVARLRLGEVLAALGRVNEGLPNISARSWPRKTAASGLATRPPRRVFGRWSGMRCAPSRAASTHTHRC